MVGGQHTMVATGSFKFSVVLTMFFCTIITVTHGSNILVINHVLMSSHSVLCNAVIEELIPRGHNVTYLSAIPYKGHLKSKVTQHPLKSKVFTTEVSSLLKMMQDGIDPFESSSPFISTLTYFRLYGKEPCADLENGIITNIMNSTVTFDVLILDSYVSECFQSIAYAKRIPVILLSPSLVFPYQYISLGIDPDLGIEKFFFLNFPQDSLIQRTKDILLGNFFMLYRNWMFASKTDKWLQENYPNLKFPHFHELEKNFSLILVNSIPAMGYARTESPTLINIGGIHCRPSQKLPLELDNFISSGGDQGFIYFSLGSSFQTNIVPKYLLNVFLEAFEQLPYRVVMKWNDNSTVMPSNVLALPWLPQQDILGDPRLRVFITQSGILSLIEAVCHGVPVITIPIITDQFTNADQAQKLGYGIKLNVKTITISSLVNAIQTVFNEKSFKNSALQLSSAIRDTPNSPKELVTWWTEYVIRNGGTERLRTGRQRLSWYQQQQLDVFILLSLITLLIVWIFYLLVSTTYSMIKKLLLRKEKLS